jgi:hypothetical protein
MIFRQLFASVSCSDTNLLVCEITGQGMGSDAG